MHRGSPIYLYTTYHRSQKSVLHSIALQSLASSMASNWHTFSRPSLEHVHVPELPATLRKISPSSWLLISNTISSLFPTLLNTLQDPLHSIVPLHSCTYIPILYCQSWALFSTSKHPPRLLCFFCGLGSEHGGLCRLFSQKCTSWDDMFGSSARLLNAIKIIFPRKGGNPNQEHDYQCDAALSSSQEIEKAIRHVAFCLSLSKSRICSLHVVCRRWASQ